MESRKLVFRQTGLLAAGQALCTAAMVAVFALVGSFNLTVLWGGIAGALIAVGNFFGMGMTTTMAAEKAANQDVKGGQAVISSSYTIRMIVMAVLLFAAVKSGFCNVFASVIPRVCGRRVLSPVMPRLSSVMTVK